MRRLVSRMVLRSAVGAAVVLGTLMGMAAVAEGAEGDSPGKTLYLKYCSACHGESGKGDGVVSGFMRPKPPDLTQIAKKAGGQFPFAQVVASIDGTTTLRAHGDPDMPVWGELFRVPGKTAVVEQATVRGKVMLITEYLASIQQK